MLSPEVFNFPVATILTLVVPDFLPASFYKLNAYSLIRIISARLATRRDRKKYEENAFFFLSIISTSKKQNFLLLSSNNFYKAMRKIILFIASSLDGFIATPSGGVDWLFTDRDYGYNEFFASVDTVLMGRKTYEQVLEFGEYPYKGKEGFVFARSLSTERDANVSFVRDNLQAFMESLRSAPGKDIWLVGGAEIIKIFLQRDWIDEFIISIHPIILGDGIPLFLPTQGQPKSLTLQRTQTFESGLIQLSYARSNAMAV